MRDFGIGKPVVRTEDLRLLTGRGRYTADISAESQSHAFFLRSPHAHARLTNINVKTSKQMPGVLAVYTGEDVAAAGLGDLPCEADLKMPDGSVRPKQLRRLLVRDRVCYVGDTIAMVVAETLAQARDAAEAIQIEYQPLPVLADTATVRSAGAPQLWPEAPGNLILRKELGDKKKTAEAFASASRRVSIDLVNTRLIPNYMEPRAVLALFDESDGRYTLYTPSQGAHVIKKLLAKDTLKVPAEKIRVVTGDVGGGFGGKLYHYAEHALCLWAAKNLKRPVKWVAERNETFQCDTHARDNVTRAEMALDKDGRFLALRVNSIVNVGAYLSFTGPARNTYQQMIVGCYDIPAFEMNIDVAYSTMTPVDAYRGAGRPEAAFVIERLADAAARELGIDPAEVRRRNFIPPAAFPFKTLTKSLYDVGEYEACLDKCLALADWNGFAERRRGSERLGLLRGIGLSAYIESSAGTRDEECVIRLNTDGTANVLVGTQASGQGHETSYAQIAADRLGLPFDRITVEEGDTDRIPYGRGSSGSRSMAIGGGALVKAANEIIAKGKIAAAALLQAPLEKIVFADGRYSVEGSSDAGIALLEIPGISNQAIEASARFLPDNKNFPYGTHICEVEIDPETGVTRIVRYTVVDDFGVIINPLLTEGQLHGAIAQGVGQALMEHTVYDKETGQLLTASFMDYCMPRAEDLPLFDLGFHETRATSNPLGVKGVAESGTVGAPPAVINAIVDALAPFGAKHVDMPATSEKIWRIIRAARQQKDPT
jgi:carbon-monoxide dehydrogenase large subunit